MLHLLLPYNFAINLPGLWGLIVEIDHDLGGAQYLRVKYLFIATSTRSTLEGGLGLGGGLFFLSRGPDQIEFRRLERWLQPGNINELHLYRSLRGNAAYLVVKAWCL